MGNMRMDMRLDAIEDRIADVGWKLAQLCLKFMSPAVRSVTCRDGRYAVLASTESVGGHEPVVSAMCWRWLHRSLSQAKKQDAVQIGQVMSQYVRAAPATVLKVSLHMFSEAFDGFTVTKEDWAAIDAEVEKTLLAGQGGAPGQGAQAAPPGDPNAGATPAGAPQGGPLQLAVMVTKALEQLPPQVLQAIGVALAQGAPPQAILEQMLQAQAGGDQGAPQGASPAPVSAPTNGAGRTSLSAAPPARNMMSGARLQ